MDKVACSLRAVSESSVRLAQKVAWQSVQTSSPSGPAAQADARGMEALWQGRWITLELETELELVGLTARFATALAERGIACNVVAGARHDHLFVPVDRAEESVQILAQLQL